MIKMYQDELIALRTGRKSAERSGEYWNKDEVQKVEQLFFDGVGMSEMTLQLGRNEVAVYQQLAKMGLLSGQCKPRHHNKRPALLSDDCLCSACSVPDCSSRRKECPHAGTI